MKIIFSNGRLHDQMFDCVSQSPMSFFHSNPSGRILNRFSKDMGSIDELLPQAMLDCFQVNITEIITFIWRKTVTGFDFIDFLSPPLFLDNAEPGWCDSGYINDRYNHVNTYNNFIDYFLHISYHICTYDQRYKTIRRNQ